MQSMKFMRFFFFFQAEDGIRDLTVTGVQTCALPISLGRRVAPRSARRAHRDAVVVRDDLVSVRGDQLPAQGLVLRLPAREPAGALGRDHRVARDGRTSGAPAGAPPGAFGGVARAARAARAAPARAPADRALGRGCDARPGARAPALSLSAHLDRKSTRLNSSHSQISYAVFCLKKKKTTH